MLLFVAVAASGLFSFVQGAFGAPAPTSVLESLTAAPAQTGASQQVVEAAKAWGAIREESAAEMEEHTNFADGLPPGIGKLAAMLVNRFGSLESLGKTVKTFI